MYCLARGPAPTTTDDVYDIVDVHVQSQASSGMLSNDLFSVAHGHSWAHRRALAEGDDEDDLIRHIGYLASCQVFRVHLSSNMYRTINIDPPH